MEQKKPNTFRIIMICVLVAFGVGLLLGGIGALTGSSIPGYVTGGAIGGAVAVTYSLLNKRETDKK